MLENLVDERAVGAVAEAGVQVVADGAEDVLVHYYTHFLGAAGPEARPQVVYLSFTLDEHKVNEQVLCWPFLFTIPIIAG
ncbi:hypothetical protein GCM10010980_18520 [Corynebacterium marinum]|nr:hypothetical protein GCM10010980_18520 [Corynebacterium marinum]